MVYAPHTRITLSGIFGQPTAPVEEWSWSFAVSDVTSGEPAAFLGLANEVQALYGTHLKTEFPNGVQLTRVRAAAIDANGHVPRTSAGESAQ